MKFLVLFLLITSYSFAQNSNDLNYLEVDSLLNTYEKNKEYEKGLELSIAASQKSGKQDSLSGEYSEWVAYFFELKGDSEKAVEYYNKTLKIFENSIGKETIRYTTAINALGYFHYYSGSYNSALELFTQSNKIQEKVLGAEHPDFAQSLSDLAVLYKKVGDFDKALALNLQAKNIKEKVLGSDAPDLAQTLNNLGLLHQSMGNLNLALPLYIRAKEIYEKALGKEDPSYATSLNSLAFLYYSMGYWDEALPLFIQGKNIQEKSLGKEHPYVTQALNNVAVLHQKMGNDNQALPLYIQVKNIREKVLGKEHPDIATSNNNLASLYEKLGKVDKALLLYIQSKNILEKTVGKEHLDYALTINNLALLYKNKGDYVSALPLFIQSKNIREKVLGKEHPNFAASLNNLAFLYESMGKYDLALPFFLQSKTIKENVLGKEHPEYSEALNNLAALYENMNRYDLAWKYLEEVIHSCSGNKMSWNISDVWADSLKQANYTSNRHLEVAVISLGHTFNLLAKDNTVVNVTPKQVIVAELAIELLSRLRSQVSNEKDKLRTLSQSSKWLQKSLKILNPIENHKKGFLLADQQKSVLLLQATKSETAYRLGALPDSLVWQEKKLIKMQNQLEAKLLERRSKEEKNKLLNKLNQVNEDIHFLEKTIENEHPNYYQLKHQLVDVKIDEVQALLDDKTALLEYVISDSILHIFLIDESEVRWVQQAVDIKDLKSNIKRLHNVLSDYSTLSKEEESYRKYTELAYWFYQNTIEPVIKGSSGIENLIIVSDGELGHLPFESFLVEQANQSLTDYNKLHYLVNDFNISYNYSANLWKENTELPLAANSKASVRDAGLILAVAPNYDIKLDSSKMDLRLPTTQNLRKSLKPLPAARKEIEGLQNQFEGLFLFDEAANEKTIKEKTVDYAILHFATHGILDAKRPVLSSLAFTEDGDSLESNIWQAYEISKTQLNANLVVLSACETGYGRFEQGNGIASLARAFMYAGAPSLIVSLWQVNDFATAAIMKNLYNNLADGMRKDEALRQAKLKYMKEAKGFAAHPAFWSPFIQMGNTQPIYIARKGTSKVWWSVGLVAFLLLGGLILTKKRKAT